jgi:hypothetical protein
MARGSERRRPRPLQDVRPRVIDIASRGRALCAFAGFLVAALSIAAQTSTPTSEPAIPLREEGHHHLIFHNSYVNVFFVEIPPHETTLPHHHDLPYVSIQPGGADASPATPNSPRIGYATGNFSHAVTNSGDVTLRNIAVELLRPQGIVRDRCAAIIAGQTPQVCEGESLGPMDLRKRMLPGKRTPLLETEEILVESIEISARSGFAFGYEPHDVLVAGLTGVHVTGLDSDVLRGGVLWVPGNSGTVFKADPDRGGHLIAITFKDSGSAH